VGSHTYANDFGASRGNVLLTVAVPPEDIVGGEFNWKIRTASYEVLGFNESREEFFDGDYEVSDRSDVLSEGEKAFAAEAPLLSRDVEFGSDEEKAAFNGLSSAGRNLYLNLRNLLAKTHRIAYETALADHGTWEEFLARQEEERAAQRVAESRDRIEAEAAEAAALTQAEASATSVPAADDKQVEVEEAAEAAEEAAPEVVDEDVDLSTLATMDDKAQASAALRADLMTTTIGHKPLARKWESAGVTEASVRRWRKSNGVEITLGAKIKGALS
jgi:hypothetical protein